MNSGFTNSYLKELLYENNNIFPFKIKELNPQHPSIKEGEELFNYKGQAILTISNPRMFGLEPYNNQFTTIILIHVPKF